MNTDESQSLTRPMVLVVDDDPTTRVLAQKFLDNDGFAVAQASDGESALKIIDSVSPDVMLLDVDMPGMSGFDVCGALRAQLRWRTLPIMMLTGSDDMVSITEAFRVGATDFSVKPMNWTLLAHRLRYLLRNAETLVELDHAQRSAAIGSWSSGGTNSSLRCSAQLYDLLGMPSNTKSLSWSNIVDTVPSEEQAKLVSAHGRARQGDSSELHHRIRRACDGATRVVRHRIEPIKRLVDGTALLHGTVQDVTEQHEAAEKIRRLAYFDSLTHLPNRVAFHDNLDQAIARAKRASKKIAVLYLDLDDFKRVNDTLGHSSGDEMLSEVAKRLKHAVRSSDQVARLEHQSDEAGLARLGGDEFAVIVADIDDETVAAVVGQRILDTFHAPFLLGGEAVFATPSIGIACFPRDGADGENLLKHADAAMYDAKRNGKNAVRFHDHALSSAARRRHQIELGLRKGLERDEFELVYQPQVDLDRCVVIAAEALLRWNSPELGVVSPGEFIPIAESADLIVPIGNWVLETACRQLATWQWSGYGFERVAVNVSVKQFVRGDFVDRVANILRETGCGAQSLELEITESVLATDAEGAIAVLKRLKDLGVKLSIDDFGTGYSSLSYLKQFPIDRLKIDRSFVRDIVSDPNDSAITSAVIGIARGMGVKVIAEGVETEEQLRVLEEKGCDEVQGFHFSPPVHADDLTSRVKEVDGQAASRKVVSSRMIR